MGWKGIEPLPITKINFFTENPNYHSSISPFYKTKLFDCPLAVARQRPPRRLAAASGHRRAGPVGIEGIRTPKGITLIVSNHLILPMKTIP